MSIICSLTLGKWNQILANGRNFHRVLNKYSEETV